MSCPALFLDRDGVINKRLPEAYIRSWEEVEILPGVAEGLRRLCPLFKRTIIVTNQQGIGKGLMTEQELHNIHRRLLRHLAKAGITIDAVYHCPELKSKKNNCRKPAPAMGLQAQADFPEIAFGESLMVGDSVSDVLFGQALGMKTARILTRCDEEERWQNLNPKPDFVAENLIELARLYRATKG